MTCPTCGKRFAARLAKCPQCGRAGDSGLFQTSTVLISTGETEGVYRSVKDVPAPLRSQLLKSTNGANSATILIADRRGREEIARATRQTADPRTLAGMLISASSSGQGYRLTRYGKITLAVLLVLILAAVLSFVFVR
jgi:hypothetical protein